MTCCCVAFGLFIYFLLKPGELQLDVHVQMAPLPNTRTAKCVSRILTQKGPKKGEGAERAAVVCALDVKGSEVGMGRLAGDHRPAPGTHTAPAHHQSLESSTKAKTPFHFSATPPVKSLDTHSPAILLYLYNIPHCG